MKYSLLSIVAFAFMLISCKSDIKNSQQYKDVMAIHDKIMPEVTNLHKLKKEFKAVADTANLERISAANVDIVKADDMMMQWMDEFKVPEDKAVAEKYLTDEMVKIQQISTLIATAKENASKLLDELKKAKEAK